MPTRILTSSSSSWLFARPEAPEIVGLWKVDATRYVEESAWGARAAGAIEGRIRRRGGAVAARGQAGARARAAGVRDLPLVSGARVRLRAATGQRAAARGRGDRCPTRDE